MKIQMHLFVSTLIILGASYSQAEPVKGDWFRFQQMSSNPMDSFKVIFFEVLESKTTSEKSTLKVLQKITSRSGQTVSSVTGTMIYPQAPTGTITFDTPSFLNDSSLETWCISEAGSMETHSVTAGEYLTCHLSKTETKFGTEYETEYWIRSGAAFGLVEMKENFGDHKDIELNAGKTH